MERPEEEPQSRVRTVSTASLVTGVIGLLVCLGAEIELFWAFRLATVDHAPSWAVWTLAGVLALPLLLGVVVGRVFLSRPAASVVGRAESESGTGRP